MFLCLINLILQMSSSLRSTTPSGLCFVSPLYGILQKIGKRSPLVPRRAFQKYHQELNKVKIEGREVKHIKLRKLPENSLCQCKASKDVSELDFT